MAFQLKHTYRLTNIEENPICILGECIHERFDVCILNLLKIFQKIPGYSLYDCIYDCIAWRLVHEKNTGTIATLTNTNIYFGAYGDSDENGIIDDAEIYGGYLAVEILRLYSQKGINTLGTLHKEAISHYVDEFSVHSDKYHCISVLEFIVLGDPRLQIGGYVKKIFFSFFKLLYCLKITKI